MSRRWFAGELETVASWWRVYRRDGITHGFVSHDHDLSFDGIRHRTAPGMVPSAIRLSSDLEPDSAEVTGALDDETIRAEDLAAGRFDGARVEMGVVDWETLEREVLYAGTITTVTQDAGRFSAELASVKSILLRQPIPQTSPTCRAAFCGEGCNLSPASFTHEATIATVDRTNAKLSLAGAPGAEKVLDGTISFLDGRSAGQDFAVAAIEGGKIILDRHFGEDVVSGTQVIVREGCDHRWETCRTRFANAVNFRGEPFLPGNDLLTRYPVPQ